MSPRQLILWEENNARCLCRPSFVAQLLMTSCWTPMWEWWGCGPMRQVASAASECCSLLSLTVSDPPQVIPPQVKPLHAFIQCGCNSDLSWFLFSISGSTTIDFNLIRQWNAANFYRQWLKSLSSTLVLCKKVVWNLRIEKQLNCLATMTTWDNTLALVFQPPVLAMPSFATATCVSTRHWCATAFRTASFPGMKATAKANLLYCIAVTCVILHNMVLVVSVSSRPSNSLSPKCSNAPFM